MNRTPAHTVTVRYLDGVEKRMSVAEDQTILEAAEAGGVAIVSECESGICGTCVGACTSGRYEMGRTEGLSEVERDERRVLTCQTTVQSDCVLELQYPAGDNAARLIAGEGRVTSVDRLSPTTALLRIDVSGFGEAVAYTAGQFAQLKVPGTEEWRSYSFAHPARAGRDLAFIVRLLPKGAMSEYLRGTARAGDRIALRCSKGGFHLRPITRPVVLVAGGTGLSAILAMAESLRDVALEHPVTLLYGVTTFEDLCKQDELRELALRQPRLSVRIIVAQPDARWSGPVGVVTELLDAELLSGGNADVYLCGPAAMVDATREWLARAGIHRAGLYFEKFVQSGARLRARANLRLDPKSLDLAATARAGKGTAVVIGGSIAGIAAAKVLSETFGRVIVLEKDGQHDRREGRPGAAQGWHLHHLLTAGQQEIERIFPGIIDDMVREGAFKVDMAEQYRLRLAGSWKEPCKSGIEIVCAGRPLLEWCLRRRLDAEPKVECRIADGAWFVIREQTLRFGWIKDVESKRPFYFRPLNWYMDRVMELVHDDIDSYRKFLAVVHLVKPPLSLLTPPMVMRVIGKWLRTKLAGRKTLIESNYGGESGVGRTSLTNSPSPPAPLPEGEGSRSLSSGRGCPEGAGEGESAQCPTRLPQSHDRGFVSAPLTLRLTDGKSKSAFRRKACRVRTR